MDSPEDTLHVGSPHSHHSTPDTSSDSDLDQSRRWVWWLIGALLALAGYVARDYPAWRARQLLAVGGNSKPSTTKKSQVKEDMPDSTSSTPGAAPESENNQVWPPRFSVRWIPFMPFALVYLLAKVAWSFFRWLVFHSLWFVERSSVFIAAAVEKTFVFVVEHGLDFVSQYVVLPVCNATNFVWQSFVLEWCRPTFEEVIVPAVVHTCTIVQETTVKHYRSLAEWAARWADPVMQTITWVVLELVYQPLVSVGSRLAVVGQTFLHTAKIYLQELAKDAMDLIHFIGWVARWLWNKTLRPLGLHLAQLASNIASLLWIAAKNSCLWIYSSILKPTWGAIIKAITILRSHPTLLAGLQALSAKVQAKAAKALHRIEEINWLLLLESVLTQIFTFLYQSTAKALSLTGRAISYFFVEMVPNAYQDLLNAIDFMRPIVEWVVRKVLAVARPCWWAIVSLAQWVAANTGPLLSFLNKTIWAPMVLGEISDVLSRMAAEVGRILLNMTGELGVKVQQTVQEMAPQFEAAKAYVGSVMDNMVVWANDAMVDWVKKEKRE
ncbi:hypothetical protein BGZ73_008063 [Actinomortierella ambigua]|nr:hypothetical protein BGZ73_008063 [Actinomortierella ambigua]